VLYHAREFPDPTRAMLVIDAGARQDFVDYNVGRALNFPNAEMIEMFCTHGARVSADHRATDVADREHHHFEGPVHPRLLPG
jgi:hypothetical protein